MKVTPIEAETEEHKEVKEEELFVEDAQETQHSDEGDAVTVIADIHNEQFEEGKQGFAVEEENAVSGAPLEFEEERHDLNNTIEMNEAEQDSQGSKLELD